MSRERILQIVLEIVCLVVFPPYLIHLWISRHASPVPKPKPSIAEVSYKTSFNEGVQLEENSQCGAAISKFRESEMYAAKLDQDKYPAVQQIEQRLADCSISLGREQDAENAQHRIAGILIDEGVALSRSGQWDAAIPILQEAEQRAQELNPTDVNYLQTSRVTLVNAYWRLKRYSDADGVYDRMLNSAPRTSNGYEFDLANEYMVISEMQSGHGDWAGTEHSLQEAIQNFDAAVRTYGVSEELSAQISKSVAEYWLAQAYANDNKQNLALSMAETAFQDLGGVHSGQQELAAEVAQVGLKAAKTAHQDDAAEQWRQRASALPFAPCPASYAGSVAVIDLSCASPVTAAAARSANPGTR
jgi:tetratricopeptide (TPR) repeat protein